ncbi:MAG: Modification methylase DpnIIA [Dehalococcoidia bacterium]|nr:Modification methylase DpnIIA [Bacillota bacterium]
MILAESGQKVFAAQYASRSRPFLKWAGGKGQLLPEIRERYMSVLDSSITKYAEPFVGGGAVLFDVIGRHDFKETYISDINPELINAYKAIRDNVEQLIAELSVMQESFLPFDAEERRALYYKARDEYNAIKINDNALESQRKAVLMIFLNRTCFNGLYRVNSKGLYNVPIGDYKKPLICDKENLRAVSIALKNVEIVCGQFTDSESFIDEHTLVYFDPPYRPLNKTSNFTSYAKTGFDDEQQKRLATYVDRLAAKGAKIITSNSDPKNVDPNDDFFDRLFSNYKTERVEASRMINSKAESRGRISEILVTNF